MAAHRGSETCYRKGCRLQPCKTAHAAQARKTRAKSSTIRHRRSGQAAAKLAAVPSPNQEQPDTPSTPKVPGPVGLAVREQLAPYAADRPGEVATAAALADLIDDPNHAAAAGMNSGKLQAYINALTAQRKSKMSRKLATVHAMSGRKAANG
jgi:hypothetical protein